MNDSFVSFEYAPVDVCRCVECFRDFPASEVIRVGEVPVCAECKPAAVAKLTNGKPLGSFWRKGKLLVMVHAGPSIDLPSRCVHCNAPAQVHWLDREFSTLGRWSAPIKMMAWGILVVPVALALSGLPGRGGLALIAGFALWLMSLVAGLVAGERFKWRYILCRAHWRRHWMKIGVVLASALLGAVLGVLGGEYGAVVGLTGLGLIFLSLGAAMTGQKEVRATRHTESHSYFRGCSKAFLDQLPEWPGER